MPNTERTAILAAVKATATAIKRQPVRSTETDELDAQREQEANRNGRR